MKIQNGGGHMLLDVKALALTTALVWGGCLLLTGLANLAYPAYGLAWLQVAASIYPGYHGPAGLGSVVVVTLYGLVDGAAGGAIFGWLYNRVAQRPLKTLGPSAPTAGPPRR
jgi:hypothetical protein